MTCRYRVGISGDAANDEAATARRKSGLSTNAGADSRCSSSEASRLRTIDNPSMCQSISLYCKGTKLAPTTKVAKLVSMAAALFHKSTAPFVTETTRLTRAQEVKAARNTSRYRPNPMYPSSARTPKKLLCTDL